MAYVVTEAAVLDGKRVVVTLDGAGLLQWRGDREGQLLVRTDLIGFTAAGPRILRLCTFKMFESTTMCGKGLPGRRRRDMVVEFDSDATHTLCCESIQKILDASGTDLQAL